MAEWYTRQSKANLAMHIVKQESDLAAARAEIERLRRMLDLRGTGPAERYWEGRWRDEAAENERLTKERDEARAQEAFNPATVLAGATETPRAWLDVMGERVRQITVEGWTPEHDDTHVEGELAGAASAYAMSAAAAIQLRRDAPLREIPPFFMFEPCHWKPTNARRDLVKAGALILAEIERLDRATRRAAAHDASLAVTDKEKEDDDRF